MIKKVLGLLVCVISAVMICSMSVMAEDTTYSLVELMDYYRTNSPDIQILDLERQLIDLELKEAHKSTSDKLREMNKEEKDFKEKKETEETRDDFYKKIESYADALLKEKQLIQRAEVKFDIEEQEKRIKEYNFESLLWKYYCLKQQEQVLQESIDFYQALHSVEETKNSIGMGTGLDVVKAQNESLSYENQGKILSNMITMLEDMIKVEAGLDLEQELQMALEAPKEMVAVEMRLSNIMDRYMANNINKVLEEKDTQLSKERKEFIQSKVKQGSSQYREATWQADMAALEEKEYINESRNYVIDEYGAYQQSVDQFSIARDAYHLKEKQVNDAIKAYEEGQLSQLQLQGIKLQKSSAKVDYEMAMVQYNMAIKKIQLILDGITVK